jgi:isopentenyl-diphosphate delta-isomerase
LSAATSLRYHPGGAACPDEVVSSEHEELILVDADDRAIGFQTKADCHDRDGLLHRAFSLFVFNDRGEVLLQRRAANKRLWPLYWSNSCCSHPRRGEEMEQAVHRRLYQELRIRSELSYLYKFQYAASYEDAGSERELCWVYIGTTSDPVRANATEIAEWRYVSPDQLNLELQQSPGRFTPWFKLEWPEIQTALANRSADIAGASGEPFRQQAPV